MAAPPSLALSAAERAALIKDPEAFARRAEAVLSSMVAKLSRVEAERAAEKIDSERECRRVPSNPHHPPLRGRRA